MSKLCKDCKIEKKLSDFTKNARSKDGLTAACKLCNNIYQRQYYSKKNNKLPDNKSLREYLKYKIEYIRDQDNTKFPDHEFCLTIDDLEDLYESGNGTCKYSGVKLGFMKSTPIYKKLSYDRIDNDLPHIKDNLQITSQFMNMLRGSKTHESFIEEMFKDQTSEPS